jgi:hypothetical protein
MRLVTTSDDHTPEGSAIETDLAESEEPTAQAELRIILGKSDARLTREVKITQKRGIGSLALAVLSFLAGLFTSLGANFDWSHSSTAKLLIVIGALTAVFLGSSIGFFFSIINKRQRRQKISLELSQPTLTFHGDVSASHAIFGTSHNQRSMSGKSGAENSSE